MEKNITQVTWSAQNLPAGISFDTSTGTFTGQLDTEGEYIVPVKVETNYGSDEKDVKIVVEGGSYPVYAIGKYAATWSGNATPNEQGFRKLPMPKARQLVSLYQAFGAKVSTGKWYIGGQYLQSYFKAFGMTDVTDGSIVEFPVENVIELAGGGAYRYWGLEYRTSDDDIVKALETTVNSYGVTLYPSKANALHASTFTGLMLHHGFGDGIAWCYNNPSSSTPYHLQGRGKTSDTTGDDSAEKVKSLIKHQYNNMYYLTEDGKFWLRAPGTGRRTQLAEECGNIREIFHYSTLGGQNGNGMGGSLLIQAVDGKIYAKGVNGAYQLGLPDAKTYADFEEVPGDYGRVKRFESGLMLTEDGKLYHTGNAITNITGKHTGGGFSQIFPELKFKDIAYDQAGQTLVVLLDDDSADEEAEPTEYAYNYIYLHNDDADEREIDLHEYLSAWSSNAGICLNDAGISTVSYAWCFLNGFTGRYVEDGDTQIISSVNNAVATYDISTGRIKITKSGNYTNSGSEVTTYILKITTNKSTEIFHITIYKNPQGSIDETLIIGAEEYPY